MTSLHGEGGEVVEERVDGGTVEAGLLQRGQLEAHRGGSFLSSACGSARAA
jgi:hypothetical protein